MPVAAILVASIRLQFTDVLLHLKYRGPNEIPVPARFCKGEEMGGFQHGSTIIVFVPPGFEFVEGIATGTRIRMGQALMRLPVPAPGRRRWWRGRGSGGRRAGERCQILRRERFRRRRPVRDGARAAPQAIARRPSDLRARRCADHRPRPGASCAAAATRYWWPASALVASSMAALSRAARAMGAAWVAKVLFMVGSGFRCVA